MLHTDYHTTFIVAARQRIRNSRLPFNQLKEVMLGDCASQAEREVIDTVLRTMNHGGDGAQ